MQTGSAYASWAQRHLVETGLIAPEQLYRYGDVALATDDLRRGQIDVVILDFVPAEALAQQGDLQIAGRGLGRQSFAVALPKSDPSLMTEINGVLGELQQEGYIATLVEQYLSIEPAQIIEPPTPVPPTATPVPTATDTPTPTPIPPTPVPTPTCTHPHLY